MNMADQFLRTRPALRYVLLFAAGILLAYFSHLPPFVYFLAVIVCIGTAISIRVLQKGKLASDILLQTSVLLLGMFLYTVQRMEMRASRLEGNEGKEIHIFGSIQNVPSAKEFSVQFIVHSDSIRFKERTFVEKRKILIFAKRKPNQLKPLVLRKRVEIKGILEPFPFPRNPGEYDYGKYLELNDIEGVVSTNLSQINVGSDKNDRTFEKIIVDVRKTLATIINRNHDQAQSSFLKGILLADRSGISPDLKQSFVNTGTIHVLAVSGLHVGIIAFIFYVFFGMLRISKKLLLVLTMLGLIFYMYLTGSPPSVVRATIMACAVLSAQLVESKIDVYQSIGLAAMAILVLNPSQIFNVGFQLSFSAVLSIVYLYPKLDVIIEKIPNWILKYRPISYILRLFAVSFAAQIGTLPFTAYYFERVSIVALGVNLIVVPMIAINVTIGFATIAFTSINNWIAYSFGLVNNTLIGILLNIVSETAKTSFAFVETSSIGASFPILYYLGIIGIANVNKVFFRKIVIFILLIGLNIAVYADVMSGNKRDLELTFLDVGQGDAIFIRTPRGKIVFFDAGSKSLSYDSGERIIGPYLKRHGYKRIDMLVLTHAHSDHIGGIEYLLDNFQVKQIIESGGGGHSEMYVRIVNAANARGISRVSINAGDILPVDDALRFYMLHPFMPRDSSSNLNNMSIVTKIKYGGSSILLAGDAEEPDEKIMVRRYGSFLRSDILKAGHHGSKTSSSAEFLSVVEPKDVIISVGRKNKFNHPSSEVVSRIEKTGIRIHRTDRSGAIMMRSDGESFNKIEWRNQSI